ncbi:hypothetical protein IFR05_001950 [Cadophora sp. M221]|nr:hypothetical protein IFR05_001950 [Cadophora sp. M221]
MCYPYVRFYNCLHKRLDREGKWFVEYIECEKLRRRLISNPRDCPDLPRDEHGRRMSPGGAYDIRNCGRRECRDIVRRSDRQREAVRGER